MDTQGCTGQRGPERTGAVAPATFYDSTQPVHRAIAGQRELTSGASGATLALRQ